MDFPRTDLIASVQTLADQGIYVGTSSWKYEGWLGLIYTDERYRTRGKFSRAKFEKTWLAEYGKVFKTVCLDAGFYQFPSPKMIDGYLSQVPEDFRMSIKVTEDITVRRFPKCETFVDFLSADCGYGFREPRPLEYSWSRIIFDLVEVTVQTTVTRRLLNVR